MRRDVDRLAGDAFDLLVVGGGIYGSWIAGDAALRGLRVALVERGDWGSGTSQASSKLIHGGLRYLEYLKFGLVRRALAERRRLVKLAPHRVYPLRFVIPLYQGDRVGRLRMEAGLWLYDRLAGGGQPVASHAAFGRPETLERYGFLTADGLKCGFSYGDCGTDDARFCLEVVAGAMEAGAACVNHVEALALTQDGESRVTGAELRDREGGGTFHLRARITINAAGPWGPRLKGMPDSSAHICRLVKGVHLVLPPLPTGDAFLLTARRDGRVFFVIPWYGNTLLGTTDDDYQGDPDRVAVEAADVEYLLTEANRALGGARWTVDDVRGAFAGVRTLRDGGEHSATDVTREWSLEEPAPGLLFPVGGKFTSSRAEAGITVDRALALLGRPAGPCPTKRRPFAWRPPGDFSDWLRHALTVGGELGLDAETARFCALRHGQRVERVHGILAHRPDLARRLADTAPFCRAEVVHAARSEMARTLDDILRRRVPAAILARLDARALEDAAQLAGAELGWSAERRAREVAEVGARYGAGDRA